MGFYIYTNSSRCIFVVEDNCELVNKENISRTEHFGHVSVEYVDEIAHPETVVVVFGDILLFPNMDSLSSFLKSPLCHYSTEKGGGP